MPPQLPPYLQDRRTQVIAGIIFLLVLILVIGLIWWANSQNAAGITKPLLKDIDQARAIEICSYLEQAGIKCEKVSGDTGGDSIMVPEKQFDQAILLLAGDQILEADDFKLFDKNDWAASEADKRVKLMRAMSGELSRLISRMDGVRSAKAHIHIPERHMFKSSRDNASASVNVTMKPGRRLSDHQVQAIISMVRGYYSEISPNNISITDQSHAYVQVTGEGEDLNNSFRTGSEHSAIQGRVQSYLDALFGVGQATAAVSLDLQHSRITQNSTTFSPGAIGTHEYSEEAVGDSALYPPFRGVMQEPAYLNDEHYRPQGSVPRYHKDPRQADPRLYKDLSPQQLAQIEQQMGNNTNGQGMQKYTCASDDEICKRNYRQHNFQIHSYPSYNQVMVETPAGEMLNTKVAVVIDRTAIPAGLSTEKIQQGVAAAAHPNLSPDNVEIVLRDPLQPKEEEKKGFTLLPKFSSPEKGGFPWLGILVFLGLTILALIVLGQIYQFFGRMAQRSSQQPVTPDLNAPGQQRPTRRSQPPPPDNTLNHPPASSPTAPETAQTPQGPGAGNGEFDFNLEEGNRSPRPGPPGQPPQPQRPRRPRMTIEDD